jgi:hypothetical protein
MEAGKSFGRRAAASPLAPASLPAVRKIRAAPAKERREPAAIPANGQATGAPTNQPLTVEQELEQWKAARKVRKRSFREPWRSVSIVAGVAFVTTSWMLPDSVSLVAQLALGVLSLGSFLAGWRVRNPNPQNLSA